MSTAVGPANTCGRNDAQPAAPCSSEACNTTTEDVPSDRSSSAPNAEPSAIEATRAELPNLECARGLSACDSSARGLSACDSSACDSSARGWSDCGFLTFPTLK